MKALSVAVRPAASAGRVSADRIEADARGGDLVHLYGTLKRANILPQNVMHFRIRPKAIQVIRTTYDSAIKGATSEVLDRIDRRNFAPSEELKGACSADELEQVAAWIDQHKRTEAIRIEAAARTLVGQVELATAWFDNAPAEEARLVAADLLPVVNMLRARLKRRKLVVE